MRDNKHIGSSFDDFLSEEGILEEVSAVAMKRVIAWQLAQAMKAESLTRAELAKRMNTSRSQVNRVLDQDEPGLTFETLSKAVSALGYKVKFEIVPA